MPDNWIGQIKLTNETEIVVDGEKVHDLIPCNQGEGVEVDKAKYPVLWGKLGHTGKAVTYGIHHFNNTNYSSYPSNGGYFSGNRMRYVADDQGGRALDYAGSVSITIGQGAPTYHMHFDYSKVTLEIYCYVYSSNANIYLSGRTGLRVVDGNLAFTSETDGTTELLSAPMILNQWVHIAYMRDGDNIYLYINGELVDSAVHVRSSNYNGPTELNATDSVYLSELAHCRKAVLPVGNYPVPEVPYEVRRSNPSLPSMVEPEGSPAPYKIVADKT